MPPRPRSDPFREYRKVQARFDDETRRILERTARDIRARLQRLSPGIGGQVRAAQLNLVLREIDNLVRTMWTDGVAGVVKGGRKAAMEAAQAALETLEAVLHGALPPDAAEAVSDGLRATAVAGIERDAARIPRELSTRVYRHGALTSGRVQDKIRSGMVAGLSARELAQDVYEDISPATPGGASYAAMRLARTEINNAFHEQQIKGAERPGVTGVKWNLSGSHKVPDECNIYAAQDKYDMGAGVYPPGKVPDRPHPQCFCYLTYVTMTPVQFKEALAAGSFDDELDRRTKANLARLGQPEVDVPVKRKQATPKRKATPKRTIPTNDDIEKSYKSGIEKREELTGGAIASTNRLTFKDGTEGVSKTVWELPRDVMMDLDPKDLDMIPTVKEQQDAEELGALLARAMGLKAPQVYRPRERETIQQFMEGRAAVDILEAEIDNPGTILDQYRDTDQGSLIGLLDQIIGNNDRNEGNWLVDGKDLIPIDHGGAWSPSVIQRGNKPISGFSLFGSLFKEGPSTKVRWKDNDMSGADIDALREILLSLRPEFEKRDQMDWLGWSLDQLEQIRPYAKGTRRRIK